MADKTYAERQAEAYARAGWTTRVTAEPFAIGLRRSKRPGLVDMIFTDYCDDGTSRALLDAADVQWIAETSARLLAGDG